MRQWRLKLIKGKIDASNKNIDNKLFDYSKELVMLNFLFERKLISKDEMIMIKQDIMKSYNMKNHNTIC